MRAQEWGNTVAWKRAREERLLKNPVCEQCAKEPSTLVAHIRSFITPEGVASRELFFDPAYYRALCRSCHSRLTTTYDGGFGNQRKSGKEMHVQPTGATGKQFSSGSIGASKLDEALGTPEDLADLLKDIPE